MKKILSALLAAVLLLSATACAAHEPVLPPSRWGEGESQGMLPHTYSLSEAYDAAEVVALVTVGDWLEEELITGRTFFRTTVQKVYKGDIPLVHFLDRCPEKGSPGDQLLLQPIPHRNKGHHLCGVIGLRQGVGVGQHSLGLSLPPPAGGQDGLMGRAGGCRQQQDRR